MSSMHQCISALLGAALLHAGCWSEASREPWIASRLPHIQEQVIYTSL